MRIGVPGGGERTHRPSSGYGWTRPPMSGRTRRERGRRRMTIDAVDRNLVLRLGDLHAVPSVGLGAVHGGVGQAQEGAFAAALGAAGGEVVAVGGDAD